MRDAACCTRVFLVILSGQLPRSTDSSSLAAAGIAEVLIGMLMGAYGCSLLKQVEKLEVLEDGG